MEIKTYSPVIIPTLNRFEHFKRCLESLERCTGAENTDIYIGLDYPPSEKYVDGWKQIDAYLAEKEKSNGFKNLYVRRRDHNCGVGKEGSNGSLLVNEVELVADRYIFSEDDNEFSPNFLEYMNFFLDKYKDDNNIKTISGYLFKNVNPPKSNTFFISNFASAWGYGIWVNKKQKYEIVGGVNYRNEVLYSWRKSYHLFRKRTASLNGFISMHFRNALYGDIFKTAEMLLENEYSVFPTVSKVRNWGVDGSGLHSGKDKLKTFVNQKIDNDKHFELKSCTPEVIQLGKLMDYSLIKKLYVLFRYLIFRLVGKDLNSIFLRK